MYIESNKIESLSLSLSNNDDKWYQTLNKSSLTPPSWVFGLVWPVLYIMIILSFLLYLKTKKYSKTGLFIYVFQFIVNLSWTTIFFKYQLLCTSMMILLILNIVGFFTYKEFNRVSILSSTLLIPYMIWILFALYLNLYICIYN